MLLVDKQLFADSLDILTAGILFLIFLLVSFSSLFDRILRNTSSTDADAHYKHQLKRQSFHLLALFSIRRNWYILSAPAKPEVRDLRVFQAIRVSTLFGVIIGHCGWFGIILPSYNPIFIEEVSLLWSQLNFYYWVLFADVFNIHVNDNCQWQYYCAIFLCDGRIFSFISFDGAHRGWEDVKHSNFLQNLHSTLRQTGATDDVGRVVARDLASSCWRRTLLG